MKHAISELEIALTALKTNEPINRANGNADQADLEKQRAHDIARAIRVLKSFRHIEHALILLGLALVEHKHTWTQAERGEFDNAIQAFNNE